VNGVLTFSCDHCHRRFVSTWSDSEAIAECRRIDGDDVPVWRMAVLCESCAVLVPYPNDTVNGERVMA
jgi:hypothetical protein